VTAFVLSQPFMRHAFLAGTAIAASCGLVGYFVVLRAQVFSGDALSHVAFTGALAALAMGFDLRLGLFVATVTVAVGMGLIGRFGRADDVVIGSVFAWMLGLGVLFLSIYTTGGSASNGTAGVSVLFGSILGLSAGGAWLAAGVGAAVCAGTLAIARPLLFTSVDEGIAGAAGVPVRMLGVLFLALVGLTAAEATQAVGALLLLGLLAAPAAAAQHLTDRPFRGLALSAGLAVLAMWAGLAISYAVPSTPPSFAVMAVATATYGLAAARGTVLRGLPRRFEWFGRAPRVLAEPADRRSVGVDQPERP
jgi:zinc/manganese transport system permease protein